MVRHVPGSAAPHHPAQAINGLAEGVILLRATFTHEREEGVVKADSSLVRSARYGLRVMVPTSITPSMS